MGEGDGERPAGTERPMETLARLADLVTPMSLRVAATLGLIDRMLDGPGTAERLAGLTGVDIDALTRLLRHLAAVGVVEERDGRFVPTAVGMLLSDDHPARQRAWLDLQGAVGRADLAFLRLLDSVRTGRPAYETTYGRPFWADLSAVPSLGESFDELMATDEEAATAALVAAYDWSAVRHMLDMGGAPGAMLKAVMRAAPRARGTLLDLPGPAERARKNLASAGLADRVDVLAGDFFAAPPVTADLVLLSFVLLNWDDGDAARILLNCRQALEPGGRILLVERADTGATSAASQVYRSVLDMRMLVFLGGRVRDIREWTGLADAAGLEIRSVVSPISSPVTPFDSCLIEMAPLDTGADGPTTRK
ncbi:methyltransferase [Spirillospora sp. NBC_00431]